MINLEILKIYMNFDITCNFIYKFLFYATLYEILIWSRSYKLLTNVVADSLAKSDIFRLRFYFFLYLTYHEFLFLILLI